MKFELLELTRQDAPTRDIQLARTADDAALKRWGQPFANAAEPR